MSSRSLHKNLYRIMIAILLTAFLPTAGHAQSNANLVIHYVEGTPAEDQEAYEVHAYLSVLDEDGNAIKDLETEDFTVTEDSQTVEISSLALAEEEPISVVLLLDNSRLMRGDPIDSAKQAAISFVASLSSTDQVAVMTFNDDVETVIDFTTDHQDVQEEIEEIEALSGTGACQYDAIYQAVQMTAALTSGQRTIIVLTNGEDENVNGGICSSMTVDDVINGASEGSTRVPIYTVGLGSQVDEKELERISNLTGGRYHYAENSDELEILFLRISNQFDAQYMLGYTSFARSGNHTLVVKVDTSKAQDQDTRDFTLPVFPTRIAFTSPNEGQEIGGTATVAVSVTGEGEPVSQVAIEINEETVATDTTAPYEFEINFDDYTEGDLAIQAVATGANSTELARATVNVVVNYDAAEKGTGGEGLSVGTILLIVAAIVGLVVLLAIILIISAMNKKKKKKSSRGAQQTWKSTSTSQPVQAVRSVPVGNNDATMVEFNQPAAQGTMRATPASTVMAGTLVVEFSDDPSMIGHRFDITQTQTTIGRSADNDINFPKDSPISRHHARIEIKKDGAYLSEVQTPDESGVMKFPTFGTHLNDTPLAGNEIRLNNGDVIRVGKRVRLKFETQLGQTQGSPRTQDDLDKTIG
jgi:VWFA-related protein